MSRLSIIVGFPDTKSDSPPSLVYLGRSGKDMREAIKASPYPRHIEIPFATGIPKNNPRAAANAAALTSRKARR